MGRPSRSNKGSNVLVGGLTLTPQSSNPIASGEAGIYLDSSTGLQFVDAVGGTVNKRRVVITDAEVKLLRATPKELVPAPGAGKFIEFVGMALFFDRTAVYTETADNLAVKYENGAGTTASEAIETTGFLDAASDAIMLVKPAASAVILTAAGVNKALVLHNTGDGEIGGGNAANELIAEISYRVHATGF
jgi:hypothetical protein